MRRCVYVVLFTAILMVSVFLIVGCIPQKIKVPMQKPAEIDLKGVKKIAVGDISGFMGREFADELTTALFNSGNFEVLDRQYLDKILKEQGLSWSGITDPSTSAKLGDIIGAAAIVVGRTYDHNYNEEIEEGEWVQNKTRIRKYRKKGTASLTITIKIIDVQTGKILASREYSSGYEKETKWVENKRDLPRIDADVLYKLCRKDMVAEFMRTIAPYTVYVEMPFVDDAKFPDLGKGINLGKIGNWNQALDFFKAAVSKNPESWKTHFDLGLAYECIGDFDMALKSLTKAYSINPKTSIQNEINICKKRKAEAEKLKQQTGE